MSIENSLTKNERVKILSWRGGTSTFLTTYHGRDMDGNFIFEPALTLRTEGKMYCKILSEKYLSLRGDGILDYSQRTLEGTTPGEFISIDELSALR